MNRSKSENDYSDNIARDFNNMTRRGQRKCMSDEFFNIWFRSILKKIIKPERYVLGIRSNYFKMIHYEDIAITYFIF